VGVGRRAGREEVPEGTGDEEDRRARGTKISEEARRGVGARGRPAPPASG
jgi:hypothetical protein